MAVGKAEKEAYRLEVALRKPEIADIQKNIKDIAAKKTQNSRLAPYYSVELAVNYMKLIKLELGISDLSEEMIGIKNDSAQADARKSFLLVLQSFEEIVGKDIDRSLRANDEGIAKISLLNPAQILHLVEQIYLIFNDLKDKMGGGGRSGEEDKVLSGGSKWYWSFVDLQARVAVLTKNITDFSNVAKLRDPRTPYYKERRALMRLCQENIQSAAKEYRTKYELAGKIRDDMKMVIELLSVLRKINVLFGKTDEAEKIKNIIDANRQILEKEDTKKSQTASQKKK